MKKSIFYIIAIAACASLCMNSCFKSANNSNDLKVNETAAKAEVEALTSETKSDKSPASAAEPNEDTAKLEGGIVQSNADGNVPKYIEVKLDANAEVPYTEPQVGGEFGSAQWKAFEKNFDDPLLSIDSGKEIVAEIEKSLDLVCDPQVKQRTLPSGVVFQAVNCVSKHHYQDNAENKKGYFYRKNEHGEEKFDFVDDCYPETTSVYVVLTSPKDHVSRVFRLIENIDIYSCFHRSGSEDFLASGKFEIEADEYPFMDVNGLYVTLKISEHRIEDIDPAVGDPLGGSVRDEKTIFLFAGDSPRYVDSWQYENIESSSKKVLVTGYSGFTQSAGWNGTKIELTEQYSSNDGESSLMDSQMNEMLDTEHHVTGDLGSAQWKELENQSTKALLKVDPGEDIIAKMEESLELVCTTMASDNYRISPVTLNDGTTFQEIHCVSKRSYLKEKNPDDKQRGYLKKSLDDTLTSDVVDVCVSKCHMLTCDECEGIDDKKEQKECETNCAECIEDCQDLGYGYFSDVYIALTNPTDHITRVHKLRENVADISLVVDAPGTAASYYLNNNITVDSAPFMDTTGIYIQFKTSESQYRGCECDCGGVSREETNVTVYLFAGNDYRLFNSWQSVSLDSDNNDESAVIEGPGSITVTNAEWNGEKIIYTRYHKKVDPNADTPASDEADDADDTHKKLLEKMDALKAMKQYVVGDFGSTHYAADCKIDSALLLIPSEKDVVKEMENKLKLRCNLGANKTMTSGTSVLFVECVAADLKNDIDNNINNDPDQDDKPYEPLRGHYAWGNNCIEDMTDLYVALTNPNNTKTRIYKLGSDFETYDYECGNVVASASFDISVEEYPFLDTVGLYISTTVKKDSDAEHAGGTDVESSLDVEVHLFASDSYCPVKQWTYKKCKMSRADNEYSGETDDDGNPIIVPELEYHKSCSVTETRWNGTEIVFNTDLIETDSEGDLEDLF